MNLFNDDQHVYSNFNSNGSLCKSAVTCIRWNPQENFKLAISFENGMIMMYDTRYRAEDSDIFTNFVDQFDHNSSSHDVD